jgi:tankyrase
MLFVKALHNASSFGHVDVATLLIAYNSNVNARDNWSYTPLHEAASKGRTQLCTLLLVHGANPHHRNQDNQTAYDLTTADDVKCLLLDAMSVPVSPSSPIVHHYQTPLPLDARETTSIAGSETIVNSRTCLPSLSSQQPQQASTISRHVTSGGDGSMSLLTDDERREQALHMTMDEFLSLCQFQSSQQQDFLRELFEHEHITLDILAEMTHHDLKEIGITAYGQRHKLLKGIERLYKQAKDPWCNIPDRGSIFIELDCNDREYRLVEDEVRFIFDHIRSYSCFLSQLQSSIREHRENCGGTFTGYTVLKVNTNDHHFDKNTFLSLSMSRLKRFVIDAYGNVIRIVAMKYKKIIMAMKMNGYFFMVHHFYIRLCIKASTNGMHRLRACSVRFHDKI